MARVAPLPRGGRGWAPSPALLGGLAVLVLAVAILAYTGTLARITGQNATPATYATATVSRNNLTVSVVGTGPVAANVNVPLSFKESGKLTGIKVNVGEKVTKGQVLATLDTPDLQNARDQATNQLASDKAKLDAAVTTAGLQEKQAELAVTAAQNGLTQAQVKASQSVQSAQTQVHSATNAVQSAQASYNQTIAPPLATDLESAKAQVTSAQAAVDQAQLNLDDATLVAPFDGTIAAINGSLEQWVTGGAPGITSTSGGSTASATAIMTLFDLNSLQVTVQVNEADIGKVQVGDPVSFRVSAFPTLKFSGKVLTIQPVGTTSANVVSYNVTCSIQSVDGATLYPGMTATTTIVTAQRSNVLLVPNTALSFAQNALQQGLISGGPGSAGPNAGTVAVLEGTRLVAKPVSLGVEGATQTEVLSGLKAGDTVVVGGSGTISSNTGAGNPGSRGGILFRG